MVELRGIGRFVWNESPRQPERSEGEAQDVPNNPGHGGRLEINLDSQDDGGAEGDRTPDLVIANDALSQLSYSPTVHLSGARL